MSEEGDQKLDTRMGNRPQDTDHPLLLHPMKKGGDRGPARLIILAGNQVMFHLPHGDGDKATPPTDPHLPMSEEGDRKLDTRMGNRPQDTDHPTDPHLPMSEEGD